MRNIKFALTFVIILSAGQVVGGSECCNSYTDSNGEWHSQEWCSDYCCKKHIWSIFEPDRECCSSFSRQISISYRTDFCRVWWSEHAWAPALIGIGSIALITLCCFGCFKLCTNNNNRTGTVLTTPNHAAIVMMAGPSQPGNQQTTMINNQALFAPGPHAGYPGGINPVNPQPGNVYPAYPPPAGVNPANPPAYVDVPPLNKAGM